MEYSRKTEREISESGVEFDARSVYARLGKITDARKAKGRRYGLSNILMIILMAKLCGEDKVLGIADWAKNRQAELIQLLGLERQSLPDHNTYRRILAYVVYEEEIERLVGESNQAGAHGEVYALDGKAMRGMRKKEESLSEYALSACDVKEGKVLSQVQIGRKENEMSKASQALKLVKIQGKVITADALHTQKRLAIQILEGQADFVLPVKENQARLHKSIQQLFAPEYPKPGFGKIKTDFETAQKVNKGHGRLEVRTIQTSQMLNSYSGWTGLAQVYRLERTIQYWPSAKCYRSTHEVEFGITSLPRLKASPARLLEIRRAHGEITAFSKS